MTIGKQLDDFLRIQHLKNAIKKTAESLNHGYDKSKIEEIWKKFESTK